MLVNTNGAERQRALPRMDACAPTVIMNVDSVLSKGAGAFFKRQLEYVQRQTLMARTPPQKGLMLFPMDTSIPPGFNTYLVRMFEELGEAGWIENWGGEFNRVGLNADEKSRNIKAFGTSYGYTWQDIQAAMQAGVSLDTKKARACRRANERFLNRVVWHGDPEVGVYGVFTHEKIPRHYFDVEIGPGSTPKQIIDALNAYVNAVWERTLEAASPDTLVLPLQEFSHINSTYRTDQSNATIAQAFLDTNPHVNRIVPANEMKGAGPDGEDCTFLFPSNNPDVIVNKVPIPFRQFPAQQQSLAWNVPCLSMSGGIACEYPMECSIGVLPKS